MKTKTILNYYIYPHLLTETILQQIIIKIVVNIYYFYKLFLIFARFMKRFQFDAYFIINFHQLYQFNDLIQIIDQLISNSIDFILNIIRTKLYHISSKSTAKKAIICYEDVPDDPLTPRH